MMELMVASLLITTMVAAVFSTVITAYKMTQPQVIISQDLARQKLETLYEGVRADWWNDTGTFHPLNVGGPGGNYDDSVTLNGINYTRSYTVSAVSNTNAKQYRKVEVDVTW